MEEEQLSGAATSGKYDYIWNWMSDGSTASASGWQDDDSTHCCADSNSNTLEQSDSGIDVVPQSRWLKLKM